jgi:nicotinamide mononucleotide transporter
MDLDFIYNWNIWLEIIGTITGIICVCLQTMEKISSWIFGIISVTLLSILFYQNNLVSDFVLHIIFLILNIYGWWTWYKYKEVTQDENVTLSLAKSQWLVIGVIVLLVTPLWGYLMLRYFNADFAFFDAFTTVGSLIAQYLLAKKYIENWLIWIIVDVISIVIYIAKGLYIVVFLFIIYLILSLLGYLNWKGKTRKIPPYLVGDLLKEK